jgi:hypothetical protein
MDVYENAAVDVRERINELLKDKGLTQNSVAAGDKPAQKRLNSQISHGAGITLDTLLRIIDACPDVSLDWLLRGNGDMYVTTANNIGANNINSQNATVIGSQQTGVLTETFVRDLLAEKDRQIQTLLKIIGK